MPQFFSTECLFLGISGLLISKHLKKPPWIFFLFFLTNTLTCISSNNNTFSKTTLYCVFASNMTAGARGDITTLFSFPSNNPLPSLHLETTSIANIWKHYIYRPLRILMNTCTTYVTYPLLVLGGNKYINNHKDLLTENILSV